MALVPLATKGNYFHVYDFRVKPGRGDDFIELFNKFDYGDNNPFHRSSAQVKDGVLCRDAADPDHFYLIGEWRDIEEHRRIRDSWTARYRLHRFDQICRANGIEHRMTKPHHPWTNGQVERMNRTLKEATVKRYYYETHDQLRSHLADFVSAYNFARRLKTLRGLTPYQHICQAWTKQPDRFSLDPTHQMPGLNT